MKVGILGAGNVGGALGQSLTSHGYEVVFGVRNPESAPVLALLERCGVSASAATPAKAVEAGEVVILAVPWRAARSALESLQLEGKVLLDCTNPLLPDLSGLEVGTTTSGGELVASWAKGARVVKIFNTTGYKNMADPNYEDRPITMLYCGDEIEAKRAAAAIAADIGFDPVDAGPLSNARLLEPHAMLWIWLAIKGGIGRDFAFTIVKR